MGKGPLFVMGAAAGAAGGQAAGQPAGLSKGKGDDGRTCRQATRLFIRQSREVGPAGMPG